MFHAFHKKLYPNLESASETVFYSDGTSYRNRQMLAEIRQAGGDAESMDFIDGRPLKNKAVMQILVAYYPELDLYYKNLVLNMVSLTLCPQLARLAYQDYLTFDFETKLTFGQFDTLFAKVKEISPYYPEICKLLENPENFHVLQHLTKSVAKKSPGYLSPILEVYRQGPLLPFVLRAYAEFPPSDELIAWIQQMTAITDSQWNILCRSAAYTLPDAVRSQLMRYIDADYVRQDARSAVCKLKKKQMAGNPHN